MSNLPFSINFFKQIEYFQDIRRLDRQFEKMLSRWKAGDFEKKGLSDSVQVNYPTWELEKKILLWTAESHKHLGSAITTSHLSDKDFQDDIHATETELGLAGMEEILRNLVSRELAVWQNGALISKKGLDFGLLIADLYKFERDNTIEDGETKYRDELLRIRWHKWLGYNLIYWAGNVLILATLSLLGLSILRQVNLTILLSSCIKEFLKWLIAIIGFLPLSLFFVGFVVVKIFK